MALQKLVPNRILGFIRFLIEPTILREKRKAVIDLYRTVYFEKIDSDIKNGLQFLKSNKFTYFPYKWARKYDFIYPVVFRDEHYNRLYTFFDGKKMYFPIHYSWKQVIWNVRSILKEQNINSPHRYLTADFQVDHGSIVIDCGVAEGNFALSVIEKVRLLYLVESNSEWIKTLKCTFEPWKDKVVFIEKFMSDSETETTVSIDSLVKPQNGEKYFIKLDIEGFEQKALAGMKNLIESGNLVKTIVCTYHHPNDFSEIGLLLNNYGFNWHASQSYVLYSHDNKTPSFRKALIRAEKNPV